MAVSSDTTYLHVATFEVSRNKIGVRVSDCSESFRYTALDQRDMTGKAPPFSPLVGAMFLSDPA